MCICALGKALASVGKVGTRGRQDCCSPGEEGKGSFERNEKDGL